MKFGQSLVAFQRLCCGHMVGFSETRAGPPSFLLHENASSGWTGGSCQVFEFFCRVIWSETSDAEPPGRIGRTRFTQNFNSKTGETSFFVSEVRKVVTFLSDSDQRKQKWCLFVMFFFMLVLVTGSWIGPEPDWILDVTFLNVFLSSLIHTFGRRSSSLVFISFQPRGEILWLHQWPTWASRTNFLLQQVFFYSKNRIQTVQTHLFDHKLGKFCYYCSLKWFKNHKIPQT